MSCFVALTCVGAIFLSCNEPLVFVGVLKESVAKCTVGASVRDICIFADNRVQEDTSKAFKKDKKISKGKHKISVP